MKHYEIYIKSHMEAPDYEDECEANSKIEAAQHFSKNIRGAGWNELLDYIEET